MAKKKTTTTTTTVVTEELVTVAPRTRKLRILLDRSGSMSGSWGSTIEGLNSFVRELHARVGTVLVSLTAFDDNYGVTQLVDLPEVPSNEFSLSPFDARIMPRGGTPLFDAVGRTLNNLKPWFAPSGLNVLQQVLIITDGQNTVSKEFTLDTVRSMLSQAERDGWLVQFLGADPSAWSGAGQLGINPAYSGIVNLNTFANAGTTRAMAASSSRFYQTGDAAAASYTTAERASLSTGN